MHLINELEINLETATEEFKESFESLLLTNKRLNVKQYYDNIKDGKEIKA